MSRARRAARRGLAVACAIVAGCQPEPFQAISASAWPEADRLFHAEPRWLGGDGAYSVDLGGARVLWLFGDSFIATTEAHLRSESVLVRNSVAVQRGADPSRAAIAFYWASSGGRPASFFPDPVADGQSWLWPGAGARLDGPEGARLLLFFSVVRRVEGGLGFAPVTTQARLIENPDAEPDRWRSRAVAVPANPFGVAIGAGASLVAGGFLHLFSPVEPGDHAIHLLRWPVAAAAAGDLATPEWYTGTASGWIRLDRIRERPLPLFTDGQTEFSVTAGGGVYTALQVDGFGNANLAARTASRLEGPWSKRQLVFRPLESANRNTLVYAAKAHPALGGPNGEAGTIATYCTNHLDFTALLKDPGVYFPRFVRLTLLARPAL